MRKFRRICANSNSIIAAKNEKGLNMEKIVKIGGHDYKMKSTAANLLKYKRQFGRDLLEDIAKMQSAMGRDGEIDISKVDLEMVYEMCWLLIKAADPELPPPYEWLDTLDSFPLEDAAKEAMALYVESMTGKESKNPEAATEKTAQ